MDVRKKGHNFERAIVKRLKQIGYEFAKTTRNSSKLLDDCKVDIDFVPFLIQCKMGYPSSRPKYDKLWVELKQTLGKNFPKDNPIHNLPFILIHHLDNKSEGNQIFQTSTSFGFELLEAYKFKKEYEENNRRKQNTK